MLDKNGQPIAHFNTSRNREKALQALLGLLAGITADRLLVAEEVVLLDTWLREQEALRGDPDVVDILDCTSDILADGVVTAEELEDLMGLVETVLEYRGEDAELLDEVCLTNQLLGLAQGLTADRQLRDVEVAHLGKWLRQASDLDGWPVSILRRRMALVLEDGIVTSEERDDLIQLLDEIHGGSMADGVVSGMTAGIPYDRIEGVTFAGHSFCPTGSFVYGTRQRVEEMIAERGGVVASRPTRKTHYLVVGSMASRDWAMGSYGRKIQYALELRDNGYPIALLSEEVFVAAL